MKEFENKIIFGDCLEVMKQIKDGSVDLVLTDPPYLYRNTKSGGKTDFARSLRKVNGELEEKELEKGIGLEFCEEIMRIQSKINAYIWCSKDQVIQYLDFFVKENNCSFDILFWRKTNAIPTFNNKYLTDKEYCLYFRRGGYCMPRNYDMAKTVFDEPINLKDKNELGHPTIKPVKIFKTLIENSTKEGEMVLDCFGGSGTTAIACQDLKRRFIVIEKDEGFHKMSVERLENHQKQLTFF